MRMVPSALFIYLFIYFLNKQMPWPRRRLMTLPSTYLVVTWRSVLQKQKILSYPMIFLIFLFDHFYYYNSFFCPSSAESAGIIHGTPTSSKIPGPDSVYLQQIGAFYSVVHGTQHAIQRCHCGYCLSKYLVNRLSSLSVPSTPSPKNSFTIVISCFSPSDICDGSYLMLFYLHFLYVVLTLWTMLFCFPLTTLHCFI